jgi:general secretion pathway protein C
VNALRLCPRSALRAGAWLLLLSWLAWLAHDSWRWLQTLDSRGNPATVQPSAPAHQPPDTAAIARLFGVQAQEAGGNPPAVPLTLLASLVESRSELSRALIESPEGRRFYRLGEPLPGGGSLREIGTTQVRIQRYGEEQTLSLSSPASPLLIPLPATDDRPSSNATQAEHGSPVPPSL